MDILQYNPKGEFSIDIARDLLRTLGKYSSDENCKKACLLLEVVFDEN